MKRGIFRDEETGRLRALSEDERFTSGYSPNAVGCWIWIGAKDVDGYGWFTGYGERKAHRASWVRANGQPVPDGLFVLHRCDVPSCVNPDHLYAGTHADNVRDAKARGRWDGINAGYKNGMRRYPERHAHVVTAEDVVAIRESYAAGKTTLRELAERFGCSLNAVRFIVIGKTWKYVGGPRTTRTVTTILPVL